MYPLELIQGYFCLHVPVNHLCFILVPQVDLGTATHLQWETLVGSLTDAALRSLSSSPQGREKNPFYLGDN